MKEESIFITGAGSGMGQMAAQLFATQGYPVAALDVNEKWLLETAENHQNIRTFNTDVTNYDAVAAVVECGWMDWLQIIHQNAFPKTV